MDDCNNGACLLKSACLRLTKLIDYRNTVMEFTVSD